MRLTTGSLAAASARHPWRAHGAWTAVGALAIVASERAMSGIDVRAPVVGADEIEISAEPGLVWDVLTAFDRWPTWNPEIVSISMHGDVAAGSVFRWKAGPGTTTSTIREVDPPRKITWTGRTFGIRAVHVWWLEPSGGATTVLTEESYEGLVARLLRRRLQKALDRALGNSLLHLKAEVERRAARQQATRS